jgi:hypothetical protein
MGARRLFSRGGPKISRGGGQEPTFCLKNNEKDTIFPKKVLEHTIFGRPGGQEPPLPSPADAHGYRDVISDPKIIILLLFPVQIPVSVKLGLSTLVDLSLI